MTNKNPNGNQTTVDAGEEEKCRSVLPDGEKSASEGLLKAVSMRSPMPSRGIPMGSGAVAHSCALGPQGGPMQWRLSMIPSRGVRCLPWALRASAVELTPPEHRRFGGANGEGRAEAGRVCFLTVPFGLSESFRQVIRVSAHVNFRSFARFRETIVQMRV